MLNYEIIQQETVWVGKFYEGGRISGSWNEIGHIDESEFRDLDIAAIEHQPEFLREFYEGYEAYCKENGFTTVPEYYDNVYSKSNITTVRDVVIEYSFPDDIVIITSCQDDHVYWEDVAEAEAVNWSYRNCTLEIEI